MLTGTVHAIKGFFMQQADETMPFGNALHSFHCQLVVIGSNIGRGENRGKLMLAGGDFIMLGF